MGPCVAEKCRSVRRACRRSKQLIAKESPNVAPSPVIPKGNVIEADYQDAGIDLVPGALLQFGSLH